MKIIKQSKLVAALSLGIAGIAIALPQKLANDLEGDISQNIKPRPDKVVSDLVLVKAKKALLHKPGFIGVSMIPKIGSVKIGHVLLKSPAEKSGLKQNDEVTRITLHDKNSSYLRV